MSCSKVSSRDPWELYTGATSSDSSYQDLLRLFDHFRKTQTFTHSLQPERPVLADRCIVPQQGYSLFEIPLHSMIPTKGKENEVSGWHSTLLKAIDRREIFIVFALTKQHWVECLQEKDLMANIAELLFARREHRYLKELVESIEKLPDNVQMNHAAVFCSYARSLACEGDFKEARKKFQCCLKKTIPHTAIYNKLNTEWTKMELALLNLSEVEKALKEGSFERLSQSIFESRYRLLRFYIDPEHHPININDEITRALGDLSKLEVNVNCLDDYIHVILAQGKYEEGLRAYMKLIECVPPVIKPNAAPVALKKLYLGAANCLMLLNDIETAVCFTEKAIQSNDKFGKSDRSTLMACCYEMGGRVVEAQEELCRRIFDPQTGAILPNSKSFCTALLKLCYRQGSFDLALKHELAILSVFPDLAYYYIRIYASLGKHPLELVEKYRSANNRVGPFYCEEARLYLNPCNAHFDLTHAEALLNRALVFTPQCGDSWLELARVQLIKNGIDADLNELTDRIVGVEPDYGELWFFMTSWHNFSTSLMVQNALHCLRAEMRSVMPFYQKALNGQQAPVGLQHDYFAASPSYCRALRSSTGIVGNISRYKHLGMIQGPWKKKYTL